MMKMNDQGKYDNLMGLLRRIDRKLGRIKDNLEVEQDGES